jgi:hypothetical protein
MKWRRQERAERLNAFLLIREKWRGDENLAGISRRADKTESSIRFSRFFQMFHNGRKGTRQMTNDVELLKIQVTKSNGMSKTT